LFAVARARGQRPISASCLARRPARCRWTWPTTDDIFAVVVRDNFHFFNVTDATAGDDSVLGAYAYHFFSENFPFRQPRWLTKGAAIYYSAIDIKPDSVVVGATPALFDDARMVRGT
jgi:hypothetical protein